MTWVSVDFYLLLISQNGQNRLIVAVNKIDAFAEEVREEKVAKMQAKLASVFAKTKFKGCAMLPVSARPGGADSQALDSDGDPPIGIEALKTKLLELIPEVKKKREAEGAFLFAVDHCFPVKGQGTVLTGTTLRGSVAVGVRPVKMSSAALAPPGRRGRIQVPPDSGTMPRAVKAAAILASSAMMRISQPSAISMP